CKDGCTDAEGAASRVRALQPGAPRARRGRLRRLPHALPPRRRAQVQRPSRREPAARRESRLSDLPCGQRIAAARAGRGDPGSDLRPARARDGRGRRADRRSRRGGRVGARRRGDRDGARAPSPGTVPARLRRGRELDGLPRAAGGGRDPGRGDRLRSSGAARPGPGGFAAMNVSRVLGVDEIDLSESTFWLRPQAEREGAFATLRAERPVPFMVERPFPGLNLPVGPGYWSLTRHTDILTASRMPELFSSAAGATSITSLPAEFNAFFGGMINMDDPRHGAQRRIVSRGFTPRALARLEAGV